jgi:hypothetical protein
MSGDPFGPFTIPLIGGGSNIDEKDKAKIRMAADAMLAQGVDKTGNDTRLIVLAALHVIGFSIGRSPLAEDHGFVTRAAMNLPAYVNAYKQDGPGRIFKV